MFDDDIFPCVLRIAIKLGASIATVHFGMTLIDAGKYGKLEYVVGLAALTALIYCVLTVLTFAASILRFVFGHLVFFSESYSVGDTAYGYYYWNIPFIALLVVVIIAARKKVVPFVTGLIDRTGLQRETWYYIIAGVGLIFFAVDVIRLIFAIKK
jgi:hypothetical protein